jgi:hypothetical protein
MKKLLPNAEKRQIQKFIRVLIFYINKEKKKNIEDV